MPLGGLEVCDVALRVVGGAIGLPRPTPTPAREGCALGCTLTASLFSRAAVLALYGVVAALQPITEFGRVYAAYGGVFIALAWGVLVDGFRPDRYDLLGALICVVGVLVMVAPPRG